uniref:Uncharacterized protein n=1 Tax=Rhizophora mucronata TaxID=61149 RepID=A0A2P2N5G8_RHIMU
MKSSKNNGPDFFFFNNKVLFLIVFQALNNISLRLF